MSVEELKALGNKSFQEKDYKTALQWYEKAILQSPKEAVLHSNKSATLYSLQLFSEALLSADQCVLLDSSWDKGYYRKGKALSALGRHKEAQETYLAGLQVSKNSNKVLSDARDEASVAYFEQYYGPKTKGKKVKVKYYDWERGKGITAVKDIPAGQVIFSESPIVSHKSIVDNKKFRFICSHCMQTTLNEENLPNEWKPSYKQIYEGNPPEAIKCECGETYCSKKCKDNSWQQYHSLMCPSSNPHSSAPLSRLHNLCKKNGRTNPLVITRMIGMALTEIRKEERETKREKVEKALEPFLAFVGGEWESVDDEACYKAISEIFLLSPEEQKDLSLSMYRNMNGIIQRNTSKIHPVSDFHVLFDKTVSQLPMDQSERKKVNLSQIQDILGRDEIAELCISGTGLYVLANCANHDCNPNIMVACCSNSNEISLIAKRNIAEGEECTISYIDEDNLGFVARQRLLKEKYCFECKCPSCVKKI